MHSIDIKHLSSEFVKKSYGNENPEGYCFSICYSISVLFSLLNIKHEITVGTAKGNNRTSVHFWLTIDLKGTILDPTIRQFDSKLEPIYLGHINSNTAIDEYTNIRTLSGCEFKSAYFFWASPLFQSTDKIPITKELEYKLGLLNIKAAITNLYFIEKFGVIEILSKSMYAKKYFEPIVTYIHFLTENNLALNYYPVTSLNIPYKKLIDTYSTFSV